MTRVRVPGRRWAYCGALLGGAVSIAANVAHSYVPPEGAGPGWTPQLGAVVGAVFWPVALFVAIEILARVAWPAGARWMWLRFGGLVPVAAVAAIVSYRHLSGLLDFYGEDPLTVVIGPLAVDGLMVMATAALIATSRGSRVLITSSEPPGEPLGDPVPEPVGDPWQYAEPVAVEPPAEPVREPARKRVKARSLTSAERVTAAHRKHPDAPHARLAELTGLSVATVKRHRPTGSPSAPQPAETASVEPVGEPVNGRVPDLTSQA